MRDELVIEQITDAKALVLVCGLTSQFSTTYFFVMCLSNIFIFNIYNVLKNNSQKTSYLLKAAQ